MGAEASFSQWSTASIDFRFASGRTLRFHFDTVFVDMGMPSSQPIQTRLPAVVKLGTSDGLVSPFNTSSKIRGRFDRMSSCDTADDLFLSYSMRGTFRNARVDRRASIVFKRMAVFQIKLGELHDSTNNSFSQDIYTIQDHQQHEEKEDHSRCIDHVSCIGFVSSLPTRSLQRKNGHGVIHRRRYDPFRLLLLHTLSHRRQGEVVFHVNQRRHRQRVRRSKLRRSLSQLVLA